MGHVFTSLQRLKDGCLEILSARFAGWTKPLGTSLPLSTLADLGRSKSELIAENALIRQQLIILQRQVKRPTFTRTDRILLVLLARIVRTWQQALVIVQPDTLLRWHRELFRMYWKRKSMIASHTPKVAAETIALIRQMATDNRLWGAERIRGELLKLGMRVCKRTIGEVSERSSNPPATRSEVVDRSRACTPTRSGPAMRLQVTDLFFRAARRPSSTPSLKTRKADPCRGDTLCDRCLGCAYRCEKPRPMDKHPSISFVITTGSLGLALRVWRKRARARSSQRRFMRNAPMPSASVLPRSVRQACMDHLLILHEKQLQRLLNAYVVYAQPSTTPSRHPAADSQLLCIHLASGSTFC